MKVAQTFNTGRKDILCKGQGEYNQFKRSSAEKKKHFHAPPIWKNKLLFYVSIM